MSLAQRLAWTDGASTLAVLGAGSAVWLSEVPRDARHLLTQRGRALGFAALVLAGTYPLFPDAIIDSHLLASALVVTLFFRSRP